jgi:hypothetical protein
MVALLGYLILRGCGAFGFLTFGGSEDAKA